MILERINGKMDLAKREEMKMTMMAMLITVIL